MKEFTVTFGSFQKVLASLFVLIECSEGAK